MVLSTVINCTVVNWNGFIDSDCTVVNWTYFPHSSHYRCAPMLIAQQVKHLQRKWVNMNETRTQINTPHTHTTMPTHVCTQILTHTHTHTHTHTLSLSHTHTHTHTLSLTHTRIHTQDPLCLHFLPRCWWWRTCHQVQREPHTQSYHPWPVREDHHIIPLSLSFLNIIIASEHRERADLVVWMAWFIRSLRALHIPHCCM